jgi:FkbM family methyltransferase
MRKLISATAKFIAQKRNKKSINKFYQILDLFLKKANNLNFDGQTNGELHLIKVLSGLDFKIVFDVGANKGEWILSAVDLFPKATFHAFELVPTTFHKLQSKFGSHPRVRLNPVGLSDYAGDIPIFVGIHDEVSTTFKIEGTAAHADFYSDEIVCKVNTGEAYMQEEVIEEIDFLKIDTEGNDFRVIKGFGESIKKVKVIQFEYGIFNIASKDLLCDFYNHLSNMGFLVGKVFPNHIDLTPYHFDMENFHGGNFLAVRKDLTGFLEKINQG